MPTTSPSRLKSGPPELPGFTATSVWMKLTKRDSWPPSPRPVELTTPAVTLFSKPNGEPIANTHSPGRSFFGSPRRTEGNPLASMRSTATSVASSRPISLALNSRRSVSLTVISSASLTTWALVRTTPSAATMKPDPSPPGWRIEGPSSPLSCDEGGPPRGSCPPGAPGIPGRPKRRKNSNIGSSGAIPRPRNDTRLPLVEMLTTAGPCCCTKEAKSGNIIRPWTAGVAGVRAAATSEGVAAWATPEEEAVEACG